MVKCESVLSTIE